jgi:hypothetical protein
MIQPINQGTYGIVVEGFGSAEGNFQLDVTCETEADTGIYSGEPDGQATCGSDITGTTVGASDSFGYHSGLSDTTQVSQFNLSTAQHGMFFSVGFKIFFKI